PALLLSVAVAVIVTRMSRSEDMGTQMFSQLLGDRRVLRVVAALLMGLGLIPGMPNLAFLLMAGTCAGAAWLIDQRNRAPEADPAPVITPDAVDAEASRGLFWTGVVEADPVALDVGYRLIPLVDRSQDGSLMGRIKGVRKRLSED